MQESIAATLCSAEWKGDLATLGATFDQPDSSGNTPLHLACQNNKFQVVEWLLNNTSVNVNGTNHKSGETALHQASQQGHLQIVKYLVAKGANVNHTDPQGWTPLMVATFQGWPDIVTFFVKETQVDVTKRSTSRVAELEDAVDPMYHIPPGSNALTIAEIMADGGDVIFKPIVASLRV